MLQSSKEYITYLLRNKTITVVLFNELWQKEHLFIQDVCESHLEEEKQEETPESDLEIDGHLLHEFLEELAQPCDNLLLRQVLL